MFFCYKKQYTFHALIILHVLENDEYSEFFDIKYSKRS